VCPPNKRINAVKTSVWNVANDESNLRVSLSDLVSQNTGHKPRNHPAVDRQQNVVGLTEVAKHNVRRSSTAATAAHRRRHNDGQ
jgi:hypothetical protein